MSNNQEWTEFLKNLLSNAIAEHKNSKEYEYLRRQQEQINELLTDGLAENDRNFVEDVLFDLGVIAEREIEIVYRQGIKDGIWLLRNLGVLA